MDIRLLEDLGVDAERSTPRLDQAERCLRALLHHVAELAGQDQPAAAGNARAFDEEDFPANRRPGEAGGDAGHGCAHGDFTFEAARSDQRRQILGVDLHSIDFAFGDLHRGLLADGTNLTFEVAYAGLPRVVADQRFQSIVGNLDLLWREPG